MKKIIFVSFLIISIISSAQTKEKVKGSKILKAEQKQVGNFTSIEVEDNLEVFLIKGLANSVEIEADDNLIEFVDFKLIGPNLRISTTRDISSYKKLSVRVVYTEDFNMVIAKHETNVTALAEILLKEITFKCYDKSKLYINANAPSFTLMANDKSKVELNLKSAKTAIDLSKNASIKALISTDEMIFDMYQKSSAEIEGDVNYLKLRLDNDSDFVGKKLNSKTALIELTGASKGEVFISNSATIKAMGNSLLEIYGDPKIDLKEFKNNAILKKK